MTRKAGLREITGAPPTVGLVEDALGDENRFLTNGQKIAEIVLGLLEVIAGFLAGVADGLELGFDLIGGGVLVVEGSLQVAQGLSQRIGWGVSVLVTTGATTTATASTGAAAAATTHASHHLLHLKLLDGLDVRFECLPVVG